MADKKYEQARDSKGKFLGKYETMEDAEKGHTELERKFGEQGKEYGTIKKQVEAMQTDLAKYQDWAKGAAPIVEWYSKYNQPISQWWQQFNTGQPAQGQGQPTPQQGQQAWNVAANQVAQTPGVEFLTPQERQTLTQQTAQQIIQQTLAPWTQQFAKSVETYAQQTGDKMRGELDQRHKAMSDVLWRTLERVIPPDKLKEVQDWHNESLKYADPKNIDPMKISSEVLGMRSKMAQMETDLKTEREKSSKYEQESLGSLGNGGGLFRKSSDQKEMPTSREDRLKNVMGNVKENVGMEGLREVFPTL